MILNPLHGEGAWLDGLRLAALLAVSGLCFWTARRLERDLAREAECGMAGELVRGPWA